MVLLSLLFGMNDPWLMNRNLNIYNLANPEDASAVRVRIDGDSAVSLYRYGALSYASGWMDRYTAGTCAQLLARRTGRSGL